MDSVGSTVFNPGLGAWVGLVLALLLFSSLWRDQALARLAQHLLVGAALGYAALVAIREVLLPRLATGWSNPADRQWVWVALLLGLILWLAGVDVMRSGGAKADDSLPGWRRLIRLLGVIPVALMLGVGVTVALVGVIQGTLLPQISQLLGNGVDFTAPPAALATGLLTLALTTATLLHLTWQRPAVARLGPLLPALAAWRWLGVRALWLAAGVLFARLAVARLSLLIGWLELVIQQLQATGLWRWVEALFG